MTKKFSDYVAERQAIGKYVEYLAQQEGIDLQEAARRSLARVWQLVKSSNDALAIMTAFRGERPLMANRSLNKALEGDLRSFGWGMIPVLGGFVEKIRDDQGLETGESKRIEDEESYFINAGQTPTPQFKEKLIVVISKYGQEAAVVKYAGDPNARLLYKDGHEETLGVWSQNKLAQYYTKMKFGPEGRRFLFEPSKTEPQFEFVAAGDISRTTQMAVDRLLEAKRAD